VARVQRDGVHGAGLQRLLADLLDVLPLAEVHRERNHVQVVPLADPGYHHRRVQPAGVCQDDLVACHEVLAGHWNDPSTDTRRASWAGPRCHHPNSPARQRKDMSAPPFRLLQVPRSLYAEMTAQAEAEAPLECCGLLAGLIEGDVGRVVQRYPLINAAASPR